MNKRKSASLISKKSILFFSFLTLLLTTLILTFQHRYSQIITPKSIPTHQPISNTIDNEPEELSVLSPSVSNTPNPTSFKGNGLYTSQLGYSFSYPKNWYIRDFGEIDTRTLEYIGFSPDKMAGEFGNIVPDISIQVTDRPYQYSLELEDSFPSKPITVNGIEGVIGTGQTRSSESSQGIYLIVVRLPFHEGTLQLTSDQKYEKEFYQIINSFKFTK